MSGGTGPTGTPYPGNRPAPRAAAPSTAQPAPGASSTTAMPPGSPGYTGMTEEVSMATRFENETKRRDRIRWGPVWAGLAVALGSYLLIQLALIALDLVDISDPGTSGAIWSAVAALAAFLLGGVVTGATAMWRGIDTGVLHGIVMWATGLVALLVFSALGSGIALGSIDTSEAFEGVTSGDVEQALQGEDAQEAAGRALLGLTAALIASAVGGAIGAKMWPSRSEHEIDDDRVRMSRSTSEVDRTAESYRQPVQQQVRH